MLDADFSDDFCRFIQTTIPDVDAAELLLAVSAQPEVWWEPAQLGGKVRLARGITDVEAARYFETFQNRGLLATGPDRRFRYRPKSEELAAHVRTLATAYNERPVTLIRMIYALRDAKIRSFADAFKLRRR